MATLRIPFSLLRTSLLAALLCFGSVAFGSEARAPGMYRLKFSWDAKNAKKWRGRFEISGGRFSDPQSPRFDADEPGTLWIDGDALRMRNRAARKNIGFQVNAVAAQDAVIHCRLFESAGQVLDIHVPLADVSAEEEGYFSETEFGGLAIECLSLNSLLVELPRSHAIYHSGEAFEAVLLAHGGTKFSSGAMLSWHLSPARSEAVVAGATQKVALDSTGDNNSRLPLMFDLPALEGIYDVHFKLTSLGTERESVTAKMQLVVLALDVADDIGEGRESKKPLLVDEFLPADTHFFRKISSQGKAKRVKYQFGKVLRLSPVAQDDRKRSSSAWIAYQLKLKSLGTAHRLVVNVPATVAQELGIALLEPNAAGQLMPTGLHTGLRVSKRSAAARSAGEGEVIRHEVAFRPAHRDVILLFHSLDKNLPIEIGKVEVHQGASPPPRILESERAGVMQRRWVGPYLHKPLLAEVFGATETFDSGSRRSLDDWVTFYEAASRLSSYLRSNGHSTVMLAVNADGSTIYPSRTLSPTPRYDTGVLHSSRQDPIRKDVVELLLRMLDRDRLLLVPQLQFSTPLPDLERMLADGGTAAQGIELIGRNGKSWREEHGAAAGHAPYYNPLDPRVQQAVLSVVEEFVSRYHAHDSLAGLAFELNSRGYLHLPNLDWGYDDGTIARFRAATKTRVPDFAGTDRFEKRYHYLTTTAPKSWIRWRCEQLAAFHLQLVRVLMDRRPDTRVFFDCTHLFQADILDAFRNTGGRPDRYLLTKGLDFNLYRQETGLTVLRPFQLSSHRGGTAPVREEAENNNPAIDALFQRTPRGTLFFQSPDETPMPDFGGRLAWQVPFRWILTQASSVGIQSNRRYAHALAASDVLAIFDGGWMIPLGQESASREIRDVIAALPAVQFHDINSSSQPAVVRIAHIAGQTYLYAVNDSPGTVRLHLELSCPPQTVCQRLGAKGVELHAARSSGGSAIDLQLPAYGIWAAVFESSTLRVTSARVDISPEMAATLEKAVDAFQARLGQTKKSARPRQLIGADFETTTKGAAQLAGWDLPDATDASLNLDPENPRSGRSALRLASAREPASVVSPPFPTKGHQFLTAGLWMRGDRDAATVKLSLSGKIENRPYDQQAEITIGRSWQQYFFRVANLPKEGLRDVRLRVETIDGGRLWIDDVDIKTHRLTPQNSRQLSKTLAAARLALNEKRYADCQRLLDSYWGRFLLENQQPVLSKRDDRVRFGERLRRIFRR